MRIRLNWKPIAQLVAAVVGTAHPKVLEVEQLAEQIPELKGEAKRNKFVELATASVQASEDIAAKDLLNDAEIARLVGGVGDAVVALKNGLAAKHAEQLAAAAGADSASGAGQ